MKDHMRAARSRLTSLLEGHEATSGMYVLVRGSNLVLGRRERFSPDGDEVDDDRLRLTRLTSTMYGLSIKRHTGRWERTPFAGSLDELVETIVGFMPHLVAPYGV